jgi:hypothetical protein
MTDFIGLSFPAVAQALSRLARQGQLRRLGKGLYYRPRETTFGPSLPNPAVIRALPLRQRAVFPIRFWNSRRPGARTGSGRRRSAERMKLFEHPDFDQAVIRAAGHFRPRGLREAIIEKDYYVTEALRIIAAAAGDKVIFG